MLSCLVCYAIGKRSLSRTHIALKLDIGIYISFLLGLGRSA